MSDANAPRRQEDGKGDGQQHAGKEADHQGGVSNEADIDVSSSKYLPTLPCTCTYFGKVM